jgi:hypothetical protein
VPLVISSSGISRADPKTPFLPESHMKGTVGDVYKRV